MTYILAQSAVTDLVSTRIHFVNAPQDVAKPYIIVTKIDSPRLHSHDGGDGLARPRFQFSIFSTGYGEAKSIADALRGVLDGYTGTMGGESGVKVGGAEYDDETDFYEDDTHLYHIACDYIIRHGES